MESKKAEKCILYYDNAAVAVAAARLTYNTPLLDICYGSHSLGKDISWLVIIKRARIKCYSH